MHGCECVSLLSKGDSETDALPTGVSGPKFSPWALSTVLIPTGLTLPLELFGTLLLRFSPGKWG